MGPAASRGFYGLFTSRGRNELKVIDNASISGISPTAGVLILLNEVAQGTDYTQRIGRKIVMKSLLWRFAIFPVISGTGTGLGDIVRCLIVYDSQVNAALPAVTDILNAADYNEPMNLNNRDRFKILSDNCLIMPSSTYASGALTAGSPTPSHYKLYKKMSLEEIFGGTGATIGSINTGAIYALVICSTGQSQYQANSRVRFVDA